MQTTQRKFREWIRRNPRWSIALGRVSLALLFAFVAYILRPFQNTREIIATAATYVSAIVVILAFIPLRVLRQKRVRAGTLLLDIAAVSSVIAYTGGFGSTWFLLYLFPILSASRYLGRAWSMTVASVAVAGYGVVAGVMVHPETWEHYGVRSAILLAVAYTASGVKRQRDRAELALLRTIERTQSVILSGAPTDDVLLVILDTALSATGSDVGAIVLKEGDGTIERCATRGNAPEVPDVQEILRRHFDLIFKSQKPLALPPPGTLRWLHADNISEWAGQLVPLMYQGEVFGVIGVFSPRRLHYTKELREKLEWVAILVAMAMKNKRADRIDLLYDIGGQIRESQTLDQLFESFVERTAENLVCEEAALFLLNQAENAIEKVAVSGPDKLAKDARMAVVESYMPSESLTGSVFGTKKPIFDNNVTEAISNVHELGKHLPSGKASHYLGVPLIIGQQVLGVIRLFNKKATGYSLANPTIERAGFTEDDVKLLTVIATQIASGIRNAKFVGRKRHLEDLLRFSPDPIISIDVDGIIQDFNPACERIWGIDARHAIGRNVKHFYRSIGDALDISQLLRDKKTIYNHETWIRDFKGHEIPISLSATVLRDDDQQRVGSIGIFKDQRQVRALQQEKILNEQLAASGQVARVTAHELKNDLSWIKGEAEMILWSDDSAQSSIEAAEGIIKGVQKSIEKINAILRLAGPQSPVQRELLSLTEFLCQFERRSTRDVAVSRVQFYTRLPDHPLMVLADEKQLGEVFRNLLVNSLAAIRERTSEDLIPGKIELEACANDGTVQISWRDNGKGMTADVAAKAFTAFYTTKPFGTGLGLFRTREVLKQHGGEIRIDEVERGATFRITLPLVTEEGRATG
jgi:PAS domain S-box-containing protein